MVHAVDRFPALHRAGRVHFHAQCAGLADQAEGELQRMDADAFGLEHGAHMLSLVAVLFTHFIGREQT